MNKYAKNFSLYIVIFLTIVFVLMALQSLQTVQPTLEPYTYGDMLRDIRNGFVNQVTVTRETDVGNAARAQVQLDGVTGYRTVNIPSIDAFMAFAHSYLQAERIGFDVNPTPSTSWLVQLIPTFIFLIITAVILVFMMRQMQGAGGGGGRMMSFGKSKARVTNAPKNKVTFAHVAGLEEEKSELTEIVDFLKAPKKYTDIGARIPRGVLLVGPPGTGKTYIAKAVAGEADVPFYSISGSDFVEMFVGVGASRVRDLFEQAKKNPASIVFIDEIDAVGRKRGAGLGGGHDEREQTLNQLLVEMDGFGTNEGVIILAATNRPDILDPALLRPGRFDRQIVVNRPDVKGREAVLYVHSKAKRLAKDVDFKQVAQTTAGFTPADLENLLNESALLAARENKKEIENEHIRRAFVKVGIGTEKKSRVISDKERRITAYHEAGHAIMFEMLSELDLTHIVSIIPTGMAGGYTMPLPKEDRQYTTKKKMEQDIIALLGGRAAESLVIKDITTGASNDIERATTIARSMVVKYGMSEVVGPIQLGTENEEIFLGRDFAQTRNYGEQVASMIDNEIKRLVEDAYTESLRILTEHIDVLHKISQQLMAQEKMTGDEVRACFPYGVLENSNSNDLDNNTFGSDTFTSDDFGIAF
ncbi:MAG: ATP-dependent zinc metalloprotease FtsH [Defluviitaleaceae bacterium]|nr:ATP-dependent zinc metalloprotease FtsH [Defluviitaleaceae bacterium]